MHTSSNTEIVPLTGLPKHIMWARLPCLQETFFTDVGHSQTIILIYACVCNVNEEGLGSKARLIYVH